MQPRGNRYEFALEIYKKFSVPFSVVAFMLLTVPLGIKRKTEGKFSGVVYSLLIFICYYILSAIMENIGKMYEASPFLICFAPNIIFSLARALPYNAAQQRGPGQGISKDSNDCGSRALRRLNRYLISNTIKLLLICELAGIVIFTMIDFFDHLDVFTETSGSSSWVSPMWP